MTKKRNFAMSRPHFYTVQDMERGSKFLDEGDITRLVTKGNLWNREMLKVLGVIHWREKRRQHSRDNFKHFAIAIGNMNNRYYFQLAYATCNIACEPYRKERGRNIAVSRALTYLFQNIPNSHHGVGSNVIRTFKPESSRELFSFIYDKSIELVENERLNGNSNPKSWKQQYNSDINFKIPDRILNNLFTSL